jgi:type VI secretion system protein ImpK
MNRDDPFAESGDAERTVIRPSAGGPAPSRPAQPQPSAPQAQQAPAAGGADIDAVSSVGLNPLAAAAAPLLALVSRIRNRAQHGNVPALRDRVIQEIKAFEQRALQSGQPAQSVRIARYALCATIDDVVLNTPWGGQSVWATQSMVGTFHKETHGGERFFDLLNRLEQEPAKNRDLLEILYLCASLGFEGRYRVEERGFERHLSVRDALARLIRAHRGPLERDLSPRWRGLEALHKPLSAVLPVWIIAVVTASILALAYAGLAWALSSDTERLQGQLAALGADAAVQLERVAPPPPPPPPPPPNVVTQVQRVATFLQPEIADKRVTVSEDTSTITVLLRGEGMFASGSERVKDEFLPLIVRVAQALNTEPGSVIVAGHSDNVPIRSARFPSNMALSLARAQSVADLLKRGVADPGRIRAEGRADREPIASNDTAEGRSRNRRIEVLLVKSSGG